MEPYDSSFTIHQLSEYIFYHNYLAKIIEGIVLKTDDFYYELPDELIASRPLPQRDSSRLLHITRADGTITHRVFSDLPSLLKKGDRLVFNNTKVIPGRLFAFKDNGVKIELFFIKEITSTSWNVIAKPAKRLKHGVEVCLEKDNSVRFTVEKVNDDGSRDLSCSAEILPILEKYGEMPIPPYMERRADEADRTTYQTVYAQKKGAVAAPTAGLHFTDEVLAELKERGIDISFVTLHVGIGTFRPVKVDNPAEHKMHFEEYEIDEKTADEINQTKANGGRIIAVGTTVVRTLESSNKNGKVIANKAQTDIFIFPGYQFKIVDSLVTNFHLPKSTLLMLVSALYNREDILAAYREAVEKKYRFFSYGDSMFIE